ncbi:hypothetical protein K2173_008354 [Erythroxylum novogranatense]|uniref:RIN4 pathogenic type III effector avirulence factor Avr cleavage site domain-containing protein n=1 Tax=Erythroxylum novogranatense TaxID=1862640 RepID=A0AAV8TL98_9ROSI|nr:hypothetical protein K2173_008354 [Erythroxylum novogranatense]
MKYQTNNGWTPVPQFGGWDSKTSDTNYSMVFSQARAKRKEHKSDARNASLGNEKELMDPPPQHRHVHHRYHHHHLHQDDSVTPKRRFLTYINCCIRPSW